MNKDITIRPGDELTFTVKADGSIVEWMADRFKPFMEDEAERVYTAALANLVGISDFEAVKLGNKYAEKRGWPERATVEQFRKWLPAMLSKLFAQEIL